LPQGCGVEKDFLLISYRFQFPDGSRREFDLRLERPTLSLAVEARAELPKWAELENEQCPNCPLSSDSHRYCPVAANLVPVVEAFSEVTSYDESDVEVEVATRTYSARVKNTQAVGSLIGIYMATSGCPILDKLRPMVLTHTPFASNEETIYRSISMYLMAQYFLQQHGKEADWDLARLGNFFEELNVINQAFVRRLTTHVAHDASLNALVLLNCFASAAKRVLTKEGFGEVEDMFGAYFPDTLDGCAGKAGRGVLG